MRRPTRKASIALVALAVIGVALLVTGVTSTPGVCASCHVMRPFAQALASSPHASTGCYACHLDAGWWDLPRFKTLELTVMYPAAITGADEPSGPGVHTATERCLECHAGVLDQVTERNGMRIAHETCVETGGTCDACHTAAIHGTASRWPREYEMERCVRCHADNDAPRDCDACHRAKLARERLQNSAWRVTHGPKWEQTHGAGDLDYCVTCHPDDYCVKCHRIAMPHPASFGRTHGASYVADGDSCTTCHSVETFCDGCHGIRMPHAATFLAEHSDIASGYADASCMACHFAEDCEACHVKHTHPGSTRGTLGGG